MSALHSVDDQISGTDLKGVRQVRTLNSLIALSLAVVLSVRELNYFRTCSVGTELFRISLFRDTRNAD
jgi:hypothetical protein